MHACWPLIIWSYIAVHCILQYCTVSDHGCLHEIKIHGTGMCSYVRHFSVQRKRSVSWTDFKKCGNGNWLLLEGCAKWCNLLALKQAKCHCMYTLSVCIVAVEEEGKPLFSLWHWAVNSRIREEKISSLVHLKFSCSLTDIYVYVLTRLHESYGCLNRNIHFSFIDIFSITFWGWGRGGVVDDFYSVGKSPGVFVSWITSHIRCGVLYNL